MIGRLGALAASLSVLASGCMMTQLHEDLADRERTLWSIGGEVQVEGWTGEPIVVAILRAPEREGMPFTVNDHQQLFRPGRYRFFVDPARYRVVAWLDTNNDIDASPGERVGAYAGFLDLRLEGGGTRDDVDVPIGPITLGDDVQAPPLVHSTSERRSLFVGDVLPLDDARFDPENARMGVWEPLRFMRDVGAGIFMLEPYDPNRIPVLYIHGIGGHPRELAELIGHLDRARFQPWVAQYPSGWDLSDSADFYLRMLNELATRHDFDRMCIVAHSMGGLLTRAMLDLYAHDRARPYIRGLVTLASPLGGHSAAAAGVRMSPEVVPAWRSLVPSGEFVQTLYREPLGPDIRYALLFAFDGSHPSDGVVDLVSQLRPEAQAEASLVRGFHTTHTGILRLDEAAQVVAAELDRCAEAPPIAPAE